MNNNKENFFFSKSLFFHLINCKSKDIKTLQKTIINYSISYEITPFFFNGQNMITKINLFKEFKEKLIFPEYFTENWDSFEEIINDLSWLNCSKFIIVFFCASMILKNEKDQLNIFNDILIQSTEEWNLRKKRMFQVFYQEDTSNILNFKTNNDSLFMNNKIEVIEFN